MRQKFLIESEADNLVIEVEADNKVRCYVLATKWAIQNRKSYRAIIPVQRGKAGCVVTYESLDKE